VGTAKTERENGEETFMGTVIKRENRPLDESIWSEEK